jgi:microcystin-dependent protein
MSEPFVGEIRMFAGNFAPRGWAFCDGQLLAVSQNDALFSLLGTIYGGDGRITFGLPDLRGRIPIHAGHGPGLSERRLGAKGGAEKVTLTVNQLPSHNHQLKASSELAQQASAQGNVLARNPTFDLFRVPSPPASLSSSSVTNVGGSQSHTNLMPFLCVNFIIALFGIYPSRH